MRNDMIRNYNILQWLFILASLVLFIGMTIGTVKYSDAPHFITVIGISGAFLYFTRKKNINIVLSNKLYIIAMVVLFALTLAANAIIVYNVPLPYYSDFSIAKIQAMYFSHTMEIIPQYNDYYHAYPFNINTIVFLGWLYRMTGDYHCVELITATVVNISAVCAGMTVKNLTKNNFLSVIVTGIFEFYSLFCMKTYMPYTANLVVLFPILTIYFYTIKASTAIRIVLMSIAAFIGYNIKLTAIIPFIGIMIVEMVSWILKREYRNIIVAIASIGICYSVASQYTASIKRLVDFTPDPTIEHNMIYYLAQGQNNEMGGQYNLSIAIEGDRHRPKEQRDSIFLNMAANEFKSRSVFGQVKFFVSKIAICWGEVRQDHLSCCSIDKLLLVVRHIYWYLALTLMTIGIFIINDRRYLAMMLGIFGVIAYLYLSEAGARYVIMFSPIVFTMAAWAYTEIRR